MKALTIAIVLTSIAVTTIAQAEVYQWEDDYCRMEGDFDSNKYTATQIKNSYLVLEGLTRTNLDSFFPPMNIDALDKLSMKDLDTLTEEYKQVRSRFERLDVVPEAKGYKQDLLKTIDGEYNTNRLNILGYLNPSEAFKQSPQMCKTYIAPLLQNEAAVQKRWKEFVDEKIEKQGKHGAEQLARYRKIAMTRYQQEKASNPAKYAKIDLVTFGFSNCVNEQAYHVDSEKVFKDSQTLNKTLFGKSFTMMCEEP